MPSSPRAFFPSGILTFCLIWLALYASPALATHPDPLPDTWSNGAWDVRFTDDLPYACMPNTPIPAIADRNFVPDFQALNILRAITGPFPGVAFDDPGGYLQGYGDLGFAAPDFDGADVEVRVYDCAPGGFHDDDDCDNGSAPADEIRMPATRYCASAPDNILRVIGHELFHHIQFAYIDFGNWPEWGRSAVEGSARMMEDQVFGILDDGSGVQAFLNQANGYLSDPGQPFWQASYDAALGWKYAAERFGTITTEPERGSDFVRRFWERANAAGDDRDAPHIFEDTIREFSPSTSLESWFHDFSIANLAKQFDTSLLIDTEKYQYLDENDGNGTKFKNVTVDGVLVIPSGLSSGTINMAAWSSAYYRALFGDCSIGDIAGFRAIDRGSWFPAAGIEVGAGVRYAVLSIDNDTGTERVLDLRRGAGEDFGVAILIDGAAGVDELAAVLTATGSLPSVDYAFDCGPGALTIQLPTSNYIAYIGPPGPDRQKLTIFVEVTGPAALSAPVVKGLRKQDFSVFVGANHQAADEATVLAAVEAGSRYVLTVWPPDKPTAGTYDLHVNLGPAMGDSSAQSVSYEELVVDEVVVLDRSGSMAGVTSPEGLSKIQSARNASKALVDRANERGKLGAVAFNQDATLIEALADADSLQRQAVQDGIDALTVSGDTSIGDGLDRAGDEFAANGNPDQPDWILLLSDGRENEPLLWNDVKANIKAAGIRVASFALGQDADFRLMEEIAEETNGVYVPLDDDPSAAAFTASGTAASNFSASGPASSGGSALTASSSSPGASPTTQSNALADAYWIANEVAEGKERLWDMRADVSPGTPASVEFEVDEGGIRDATFAFHWSSASAGVGIVVTRPDLTVLSNAVPGVQVFSDATHVVYHVDSIGTGTWTVDLSAANSAAEVVGALAGRDLQAATLGAFLGGTHDEPNAVSAGIRHLSGLPEPIVAVLSDKAGPIAAASVRALVRHPDGSLLDLPLFDDGGHRDGASDDGVYGNAYTRTTSAASAPNFGPEGAYAVTVVASGQNNLGQSFLRLRKLAFLVGEPRDPDPDSDGDGMPDRYEALHACLDPASDDALGDPDFEALRTIDEWLAGTDPCHPDTDRGGESDASELGRGANPFDPADDTLPPPIGPEVIDYVVEHLPFPPGIALQSQVNLIRYPANPAYDRIRLWRTTNPAGGFAVVADFDSTLFGGLYADTGLVNGTPYYYSVQPVDLNGNTGAHSIVFSGTPKANPIPPIGSVIIANGALSVESVNATLSLVASGDTTDMMLTNTPTYDPGAWQPFQANLQWALAPDANGLASVYARFRDVDGNESPSVYSDDILVVAGGSSGGIEGVVSASGLSDLAGIAVRVDGHPELPPVFTLGGGQFSMPNLPPGSYTLIVSRGGYAPITLEGVVVDPGFTIDVGTIELVPIVPIPSGLRLVLIAAIAGLAARRVRIRRCRRGTWW